MDHNLLISELQALIVESKRRYPDVKDAGDHALELLRNGPASKDTISGHADDLLRPITLGCKTKVAKIVGISIAALQRLVSLGGVPTSGLPSVLQTLASVSNQAVDIQLKILQALLSILTYNKEIHDDVLGSALLLCFKLQESRVSVVSSTAAATLRQAVMLVFDRVTSDAEAGDTPLILPTDPASEVAVSASAVDAYNVLSDLCLHTATSSSSGMSLWGGSEKEKPRILKLGSLQRTFGLELIESILGGYEKEIKNRPELVFLLQHSLAPLLLKLQAEKPTFPVALRVFRLIFLLIRFYAAQLEKEIEVFLLLLLRVGASDGEGEETVKKDATMAYQRVLALEALRGICGDAFLLQSLFGLYDARSSDSPKLFARVISALSHLVHEKPALMGASAEIQGLGLPTESTNTTGYFDVGLGIVSAAASAGVSTVSSMMGSTGGGLGQQSSVKQKLYVRPPPIADDRIEQHDKVEVPPTPETYPYLLALQSLIAIAEGIYHAVAQDIEPLDSVRSMADTAWPALLAALSFCIGTNLSDQIFAELISAFQSFTIACGLLQLHSPRDAFLSTLGKYAVPPPVVSAMQSFVEGSTGRSASAAGAEALGLTSLGVGGPAGPPSLSERNLACLKSVVTISRTLSSSLGDAWHDVLEILQNANFLISRRPAPGRRPTLASPIVASPARPRDSTDSERPDAFTDLDTESLQTNINALFEGTRDLDDEAFSIFVAALCTLSSAMIGSETSAGNVEFLDTSVPSMPSTPRSASFMLSPGDSTRRRASGLHVSNSMKSGERSFSLTKLRVVTNLNLPRIISSSPTLGWDAITQHLLLISRHSSAPSAIRMQASDALGEFLTAAIRAVREARVQHQVFDVLVHQVDSAPVSNTPSVDYEVRSAGFQTLNQILESSGHSLEVGWQTIFDMLNSVCKEPAAPLRRSDSSLSIQSIQIRPSVHHKGDANLVRIAFPAINLICTDFLSSLDVDAMRSCIACLGRFGSQKEAVNISLASIGLMWNVSDAVQATSKDLWLYLFGALLELSRDDRLEVRSGAMQTLFRCLEIYGAALDAGMWSEVLGGVVFPLLDTVRADESQDLALTSIGTIFSTFLPHLAPLPGFDGSYRRLLAILFRTFTSEHRSCCTSALKALERILQSIRPLRIEKPAAASAMLDATWSCFGDMASALDSPEPFSQETLVVFVKVATLLHSLISWDDERRTVFSNILRGIMSYSRSPEYRLDVDMMSPLQLVISELVASSAHLGTSIVLSDIAEFASLAFAAEGSVTGRLTYVALSKFCMPQIGEVFARGFSDKRIYEDGTVQAVLGALLIPVKLKYDCPAPSKYGNDSPLWRTALSTVIPIVESTLTSLENFPIPAEQSEAIWSLVMEIFAGILLADASDKENSLEEDEDFILSLLGRMLAAIKPRLGLAAIPNRIRDQFGETLRKASLLYHHERRSLDGRGTTAPVVAYEQERTRYWAFEALITSSSSGKDVKGKQKETDLSIARACLAALMRRVSVTMREFLSDAKLRGRMPFPRIREEELMFILRHMVVLRIAPDTLPTGDHIAPLLKAASTTSTRAHLFTLYSQLLELSFFSGPVPTMWIFPAEHKHLFEDPAESPALPNGSGDRIEDDEAEDQLEMNAGDGGDLLEVTARDLARRCLELIGVELGLSA